MFFSIIITTYNYGKYIRESVESALNQDFSDKYEIIVVDDCSSDDTSLILDDYDSLIRINNEKNLSIEVSINKGIRKASGKYIVRLDADDYLEYDFLTEVSRNIESEHVFYYGDYTLVSGDSSHLSKVNLIEFDKDEVKCRGDFLATGTVYPKKMLLEIGLYNEKIKNCGLENYQLVLKLMDRGFRGKHIKKNLFFYRRHGSNLSDKRFLSINNYGNELARKFGLDFYSINQYHPYLNIEDINKNTLKHINYARY
jgi:glycosyltransferase involved in cell wall biosynthesis